MATTAQQEALLSQLCFVLSGPHGPLCSLPPGTPLLGVCAPSMLGRKEGGQAWQSRAGRVWG